MKKMLGVLIRTALTIIATVLLDYRVMSLAPFKLALQPRHGMHAYGCAWCTPGLEGYRRRRIHPQSLGTDLNAANLFLLSVGYWHGG